jgi:hypothetical protein
LFGFGEHYPSRCGLPVMLVQGYGTLPKALEDQLFTGPYPKLCTSRWLVRVCRASESATPRRYTFRVA